MEDFLNIYEELSSLDEDRKLDKIKSAMHSTHGKDYESIAVGRLIFEALKLKLDFETQYAVRLQDGKLYLIDLYFPQINLAVECDESQHLYQVSEDEARQAGIVNAVNADFMRINAHDTGDTFIAEIEAVLAEINSRKTSYNGKTTPDYDYNAKPQNKERLHQKTELLNIKKYLEEKNISSKFLNQPITSGEYADALKLEYNDGNIKYIALVKYPAKLVISICYDLSIDEAIRNNLFLFRSIKNVASVGFAKRQDVLRLDIKTDDFRTDLFSNVDQAIQVALDAKNIILSLN